MKTYDSQITFKIESDVFRKFWKSIEYRNISQGIRELIYEKIEKEEKKD